MRKNTFIVSFIVGFMIVSTASAQEPERNAGISWRAKYRAMLEEGKKTETPDSQPEVSAYGYTQPEEVALENAVTFALSEEKGDRACECLTTAVEYEYNAYLVLKMIYGIGGDLEIDPLCMCATEAGITPAIIADAATDAISLQNEPVYDVDEISRSQCLTGLAYTPVADPGETPTDIPTPQSQTTSIYTP